MLHLLHEGLRLRQKDRLWCDFILLGFFCSLWFVIVVKTVKQRLVKSCGLLSGLTGQGWLRGGEAQTRGNI